LGEQIWGEGTFVDFEHSLNVAMNKLRRTLNDSAETPRYIETVSGRGYRFIGSIEETVKPDGIAAGPAAKPLITDDASTSAAALPAKARRMATHRGGIIAALLTFVTIAVFAYHGRLRQARTMSHRAVDLARQSNNLESAAQHEAAAAVREALFGSPADARKHASAALAMSNGRDAEYGAAVALALSKDDFHARSLADDLGRRYPEDTLIRFLYIPTLRAILAINHQNFSEGIKLLEAAAPTNWGG
jgi:hypothetical protein